MAGVGGDASGSVNVFTAALRAGDVRAFFSEAKTLHSALKQEGAGASIISNRRYHLRTYKACFRGADLVDHLTQTAACGNRIEAAAVGSSLVLHGVIHHVVDDHNFRDNGNFYRFRWDEEDAGRLLDQPSFQETAQLAVRLHSFLGVSDNNVIANRSYGTSTFKLCFVGSAMTTWLVSQGIAEDRPAAIGLCRRLLEFGFISHVCDDHDFKDEYLFYRFYADALQHAPEFLDFVRIVGGLCYMGHIKASLHEHDPWERRLTGLGATYVLSDAEAAKKEQGLSELMTSAFAGMGMTVDVALELMASVEAQQNRGSVPDDDQAATPGGLSEADASSSVWKRTLLGNGFLAGELDAQNQARPTNGFGQAHRQNFDEETEDSKAKGAAGNDAVHMALDQLGWFHGDIKRDEAVRRFKKDGNRDGSWLLRHYRKAKGWLVLSQCYQAVVYHAVIQNAALDAASVKAWGFGGASFRIFPGASFESVQDLVEFYKSHPHDEMPCFLTTPVLNRNHKAAQRHVAREHQDDFC